MHRTPTKPLVAQRPAGSMLGRALQVELGRAYAELADVFSFGINLWELWTRQVPYEGMQPIQIVNAVVHQKKRPAVPDDCPSTYKALMEACWEQEPSARPSFGEITKRLAEMLAVAEADAEA